MEAAFVWKLPCSCLRFPKPQEITLHMQIMQYLVGEGVTGYKEG